MRPPVPPAARTNRARQQSRARSSASDQKPAPPAVQCATPATSPPPQRPPAKPAIKSPPTSPQTQTQSKPATRPQNLRPAPQAAQANRPATSGPRTASGAITSPTGRASPARDKHGQQARTTASPDKTRRATSGANARPNEARPTASKSPVPPWRYGKPATTPASKARPFICKRSEAPPCKPCEQARPNQYQCRQRHGKARKYQPEASPPVHLQAIRSPAHQYAKTSAPPAVP